MPFTRRQFLARSVATCAALGLPGGRATGASEAAFEPPEETILGGGKVFDLVEALPAAEIELAHKGPFASGMDSAKAQVYFSSGWHPLEQDGTLWSKSRNAVIEVPIVRPRDAVMRLVMEGPPEHKQEASSSLLYQRVTILWNGREMGEYAFHEREIQVEIPLSRHIQHYGPNRLELLPLYWIRPSATGASKDSRSLGFRLKSMQLIQDPPELAGTLPKRVDGSILQPPGSVITYYVKIPEGSIFESELVLPGLHEELQGGVEAEIALTLLTRDLEEHRLFATRLPHHRPVPMPVSTDLSKWAGQTVALSLSFSAIPSRFASHPEEYRVARSEVQRRPGTQGPHDFGFSSPKERDLPASVRPGEALDVYFWIAADTEPSVSVRFNQEEFAPSAYRRADIDRQLPERSYRSGFRTAIPGAAIQQSNLLEIRIGGTLEYALDFTFENGSEKDAALVQLPPGKEPVIRWKAPRIAGDNPSQPVTGPPIARKAYNIVMILSDALRADHLTAYNPRTEVTTPGLTRWAQKGAVFQNSFANASWTRPSIASILTSCYPAVHRVLHRPDALTESLPFLPQLLRDEAGYRTLAVLSNPNITPQMGFARGFDVVDEHYRVRSRIERRATTPEMKADFFWSEYFAPFLQEAAQDPFFIFFHEMDPHDPYDPHPPYDTMYDAGRGNINLMSRTAGMIRDGTFPLSPGDIRYLHSQYKGEISFLDQYLAILLERFEQAGLPHDTLFVFLSDHGDEFGEHGGIGHGTTLYDEMLYVPLVFRLDGVIPEGRKIEAWAEHVDVAPTLLDLVGLPKHPLMQGRSLLPDLVAGDGPEPERVSFADHASIEAVRAHDWKLIRTPKAWETELYDMNADPGETVDRWPQELVLGKLLLQEQRRRKHIESARETIVPGKVDAAEMDPEIAEDLKALGYLE